ncbi:hypothetical protein V8G54_002440 [Vigna mungo]|uniref:Uncharacterized protein n=1 Tax=Vigna mungo TaxID=3915 RepID=A0AAQ3SCJ6_VIGMU
MVNGRLCNGGKRVEEEEDGLNAVDDSTRSHIILVSFYRGNQKVNDYIEWLSLYVPIYRARNVDAVTAHLPLGPNRRRRRELPIHLWVTLLFASGTTTSFFIRNRPGVGNHTASLVHLCVLDENASWIEGMKMICPKDLKNRLGKTLGQTRQGQVFKLAPMMAHEDNSSFTARALIDWVTFIGRQWFLRNTSFTARTIIEWVAVILLECVVQHPGSQLNGRQWFLWNSPFTTRLR